MLGFVSLARLSEAAGSARGETAPPGLGVVEVASPEGGGEILAGGVAGRVAHLQHTLQLSLVQGGPTIPSASSSSDTATESQFWVNLLGARISC